MRTTSLKQSGLTLVEVLVASILLFTAISLASVTYRSATKTELSSENAIFRAVALGFIREMVSEELRVNPTAETGDGRWGKFEFSWEITDIKSKSAKAGFDIESNMQTELGRQLRLASIEITINGQVYEYEHLSW